MPWPAALALRTMNLSLGSIQTKPSSPLLELAAYLIVSRPPTVSLPMRRHVQCVSSPSAVPRACQVRQGSSTSTGMKAWFMWPSRRMSTKIFSCGSRRTAVFVATSTTMTVPPGPLVSARTLLPLTWIVRLAVSVLGAASTATSAENSCADAREMGNTHAIITTGARFFRGMGPAIMRCIIARSYPQALAPNTLAHLFLGRLLRSVTAPGGAKVTAGVASRCTMAASCGIRDGDGIAVVRGRGVDGALTRGTVLPVAYGAGDAAPSRTLGYNQRPAPLACRGVQATFMGAHDLAQI